MQQGVLSWKLPDTLRVLMLQDFVQICLKQNVDGVTDLIAIRCLRSTYLKPALFRREQTNPVMGLDYYALLGLQRGASDEDIKRVSTSVALCVVLSKRKPAHPTCCVYAAACEHNPEQGS